MGAMRLIISCPRFLVMKRLGLFHALALSPTLTDLLSFADSQILIFLRLSHEMRPALPPGHPHR